MRLVGIKHSVGGRMPDDETTKDLADFIGTAQEKVQIVSGSLPPNVYNSPRMAKSFQGIKDKGVQVEIVVGPKVKSESLDTMREYGFSVNVADQWPNRHFVIVDNRHARIEAWHPMSSETCDQFIIHNYKYASVLSERFNNLLSHLNGKTPV